MDEVDVERSISGYDPTLVVEVVEKIVGIGREDLHHCTKFRGISVESRHLYFYHFPLKTLTL
jgi:hypothetical protein